MLYAVFQVIVVAVSASFFSTYTQESKKEVGARLWATLDEYNRYFMPIQPGKENFDVACKKVNEREYKDAYKYFEYAAHSGHQGAQYVLGYAKLANTYPSLDTHPSLPPIFKREFNPDTDVAAVNESIGYLSGTLYTPAQFLLSQIYSWIGQYHMSDYSLSLAVRSAAILVKENNQIIPAAYLHAPAHEQLYWNHISWGRTREALYMLSYLRLIDEQKWSRELTNFQFSPSFLTEPTAATYTLQEGIALKQQQLVFSKAQAQSPEGTSITTLTVLSEGQNQATAVKQEKSTTQRSNRGWEKAHNKQVGKSSTPVAESNKERKPKEKVSATESAIQSMQVMPTKEQIRERRGKISKNKNESVTTQLTLTDKKDTKKEKANTKLATTREMNDLESRFATWQSNQAAPMELVTLWHEVLKPNGSSDLAAKMAKYILAIDYTKLGTSIQEDEWDAIITTYLQAAGKVKQVIAALPFHIPASIKKHNIPALSTAVTLVCDNHLLANRSDLYYVYRAIGEHQKACNELLAQLESNGTIDEKMINSLDKEQLMQMIAGITVGSIKCQFPLEALKNKVRAVLDNAKDTKFIVQHNAALQQFIQQHGKDDTALLLSCIKALSASNTKLDAATAQLVQHIDETVLNRFLNNNVHNNVCVLTCLDAMTNKQLDYVYAQNNKFFAPCNSFSQSTNVQLYMLNKWSTAKELFKRYAPLQEQNDPIWVTHFNKVITDNKQELIQQCMPVFKNAPMLKDFFAYFDIGQSEQRNLFVDMVSTLHTAVTKQKYKDTESYIDDITSLLALLANKCSPKWDIFTQDARVKNFVFDLSALVLSDGEYGRNDSELDSAYALLKNDDRYYRERMRYIQQLLKHESKKADAATVLKYEVEQGNYFALLLATAPDKDKKYSITSLDTVRKGLESYILGENEMAPQDNAMYNRILMLSLMKQIALLSTQEMPDTITWLKLVARDFKESIESATNFKSEDYEQTQRLLALILDEETNMALKEESKPPFTNGKDMIAFAIHAIKKIARFNADVTPEDIDMLGAVLQQEKTIDEIKDDQIAPVELLSLYSIHSAAKASLKEIIIRFNEVINKKEVGFRLLPHVQELVKKMHPDMPSSEIEYVSKGIKIMQDICEKYTADCDETYIIECANLLKNSADTLKSNKAKATLYAGGLCLSGCTTVNPQIYDKVQDEGKRISILSHNISSIMGYLDWWQKSPAKDSYDSLLPFQRLKDNLKCMRQMSTVEEAYNKIISSVFGILYDVFPESEDAMDVVYEHYEDMPDGEKDAEIMLQKFAEKNNVHARKLLVQLGSKTTKIDFANFASFATSVKKTTISQPLKLFVTGLEQFNEEKFISIQQKEYNTNLIHAEIERLFSYLKGQSYDMSTEIERHMWVRFGQEHICKSLEQLRNVNPKAIAINDKLNYLLCFCYVRIYQMLKLEVTKRIEEKRMTPEQMGILAAKINAIPEKFKEAYAQLSAEQYTYAAQFLNIMLSFMKTPAEVKVLADRSNVIIKNDRSKHVALEGANRYIKDGIELIRSKAYPPSAINSDLVKDVLMSLGQSVYTLKTIYKESKK
ncbi:MAG: hypothetical protein WCE21_00630 [Candidatus Babeliales bacterium]